MYSPMMQQYIDLKNKNKECLIFFRLGDFYELFFDDAITVSKELELTLTARDCGSNERAPMCGVPYHAADNYIARLVERGYKVAVAEQMEDPKKTKTLVKREIIRIVTKGTITGDNILDESTNNYIASVFKKDNNYGISTVDVTTGEFLTLSLEKADERKVLDELAKFNPAEIILNIEADCLKKIMGEAFNIKPEIFFDWAFDFNNANNKLCEHFKTLNLNGFGLSNSKCDRLCIASAGALLEYLSQIQKDLQPQITSLKKYFNSDFMIIDISSRRNLELTQTNHDKNKKGSLVWVLDDTKTAMGSRLIKRWIEQPLIDANKINNRLDLVEEFLNHDISRAELRELLNTIYDIERLASKIAVNSANPKDLVCLCNSLKHLPDIKNILSTFSSRYAKKIFDRLDTLDDIYNLIFISISEDAGVNDKDFIKPGFSKELDHLREIKNHSSKIISDIETKEREKTGIKNLKIKSNRVFGYYIEVTNSYKNMVPDYFIRKQTLANCERYFTQELKTIEEEIYNAEEKIDSLEHEIFLDIIKKLSQHISRLQQTAYLISVIDVISNFAYIAEKNKYIKPIVNADGIINIKDGRHPVVEKFMSFGFIPNDTFLDLSNERLSIITGPNMAGKSTYMRQVALIVLMAQVGCFVPASSATIGVVDRIFTRVGASDDLASGQSTFMVEMNEVANILNCATKNSLVIIDEVGRGTGTYDGLSIAWAVVEYISHKIGCKTLFATHYHELTELEIKVPGVKNYCAAVEEKGDSVTFLRKIIPGCVDHSYGIYVAKLAGLPSDVLERAQEIFNMLDENDTIKNTQSKEIFYGDKRPYDKESNKIIIKELKNIDIKKMSVREILRAITLLQNKI